MYSEVAYTIIYVSAVYGTMVLWFLQNDSGGLYSDGVGSGRNSCKREYLERLHFTFSKVKPFVLLCHHQPNTPLNPLLKQMFAIASLFPMFNKHTTSQCGRLAVSLDVFSGVRDTSHTPDGHVSGFR